MLAATGRVAVYQYHTGKMPMCKSVDHCYKGGIKQWWTGTIPPWDWAGIVPVLQCLLGIIAQKPSKYLPRLVGDSNTQIHTFFYNETPTLTVQVSFPIKTSLMRKRCVFSTFLLPRWFYMTPESLGARSGC